MWVWNAVNQQDIYILRTYIYIYSKNNKLLHWYVSVTCLVERARLWYGLKVSGGVGETSVLENSVCSLRRVTGAALPSSSFSAGHVCRSSRKSSFGSSLKIWLLTAEQARNPIFFFHFFFLKAIRSKEPNLAIVLTLVNWQLYWNYPAVENSLCCFSEIRT